MGERCIGVSPGTSIQCDSTLVEDVTLHVYVVPGAPNVDRIPLNDPYEKWQQLGERSFALGAGPLPARTVLAITCYVRDRSEHEVRIGSLSLSLAALRATPLGAAALYHDSFQRSPGQIRYSVEFTNVESNEPLKADLARKGSKRRCGRI